MKPFQLTKEELSAIQPLTRLDFQQERELNALNEELTRFTVTLKYLNLLKTTKLTNKGGDMPLFNRAETELKKVLSVTVSLDTVSADKAVSISFSTHVGTQYVRTYALSVFTLDYFGRLVLDSANLEKWIAEYVSLVEKYTYYVKNFNLLKAQKLAAEKVIEDAGNGLPQCLRLYLDYSSRG